MYRKLLILSFIASSLLKVNAQTTDVAKNSADTVKHFVFGGFSSLTFNQVSLSNWVAGGENAISATGILNLIGNYKKDKVAWDNSLDLGYGFLKSGSQGVKKNEDKIEFNSKFGYKAAEKLYYTVLLNYRSQFGNGYKYINDSTRELVSRFNAPGYLSLSVGLDYKPTDYFSVYLSPIGGRLTIVSDRALADSGAYGVDPAVKDAANNIIEHGKTTRMEYGATLSAKFQKDVFKNVNVLSKLVLFNNYLDKHTDNRKNIDVNWEVMINIKAGKYLTTSITTNLIYDQDVIAKTQFKESFGLGVSYKF
jgi:hypothetical protein